MPDTEVAAMFDAVQAAPPDAILGLTEAFKADPNPEKISLGVGVYKDESGQTPVLEAVKQAEQRILTDEATKSYKPIAGDPAYRRATRALLFGEGHPLVESGRANTADTPGGTGALRVAGDYLKSAHPDATLWVSDPTWANHGAVFAAAGVPTKAYPYYDAASFGLNFAGMIEALSAVPAGDVVLLHGCCHNPTGVDLSADQWKQVAALLAERGVLPMIDIAYQGLAEDLDTDAAGPRLAAEVCDELLICSSYSKNFSLYNERVGALTVVTRSAETTAAVFSRIEQTIRRNYSNPPAHGATIVQTILNDAGLATIWRAELAKMRDRINHMRTLFAGTLDANGVSLSASGNDFITAQRGMFSFSGLSKDHVARLKADYSIYIVGSGRINVAGITPSNCDRLCEAIAAVTKG